MNTLTTSTSPSAHTRGIVKDSDGEMATLETDLLSSLIAFMRPVITAHFPSPQGYDHEHPATYVTEGPEGKNLVSALKDFFEANVIATSQPERKNIDRLEEVPGLGDTDTVLSLSPPLEQLAVKDSERTDAYLVPMATPLVENPWTELDRVTLVQTRAYVFNKMPIRLLSFDASGSNPRLIERDEIFRRILPSVQLETQTEQFQSDWSEALKLLDIGGIIMQRRDGMATLVEKAIEHVAHYAILSHTWMRGSPGDVVFGDWNNRAANPVGYAKVAHFCEVAATNHKLTLGWLDTVCINKESSSELDESIRSMYSWYRGSSVCITYLAETDSIDDGTHDSWFTRGWTLQELLAPKRSFFYNKHWQLLGTTEDEFMQSLITAETTISKRELDLCRDGNVDSIPLSRRMQMASARQVTREEDSSYSLLGLLGVDISVAYGEGAARAFHRLFRELLVNKKNVMDLFNRGYCRGDSLIPPSIGRYSSRNPAFDHATSGSILDRDLPSEPIIVTHRGVRIQCLLIPCLSTPKINQENYKSVGKFYQIWDQTTNLVNGENMKFSVKAFDTRLYPSFVPDAHLRHLTNSIPIDDILQTIAVVNFHVAEDMVILPEFCLGIYFYTPDNPGRVGTSSKITLKGAVGPHYFSLIGDAEQIHRIIPVDELHTHGMQLVTLYL